MKLSRELAEAAFKAVTEQFKDYLYEGWEDHLKLVEEHDWGSPNADGAWPWGVVWEMGPSEWALVAGPYGGHMDGVLVQGAVDWPDGVYKEAANSWSVRLYPGGDVL